MISPSDISELLAELVVEPVARNAELCQRAEEAAMELANETYAAAVVTGTLPAARFLSWNDLPTAAGSLLDYPIDLARAQVYGWSAWLAYLEKQQALLLEHTNAKR